MECLASSSGWWLHLRRCAECGHIGCCDSSPSQHASKHAATTGHSIITSFEPGEDWFYDYETRGGDRRRDVASAAFASEKSAHSGSGKQGAVRLGIAPELEPAETSSLASLPLRGQRALCFGWARFSASRKDGRCSPSLSQPCGQAFPQSERLEASAEKLPMGRRS